MKVLSEQKIRSDVFRLKLEDHLLKRLIADAARDKLREAGVEGVPDQLRFAAGQVDVELKQLEEGSPSYKVDKWEAFIDVRLDRSEVAPGTKPA